MIGALFARRRPAPAPVEPRRLPRALTVVEVPRAIGPMGLEFFPLPATPITPPPCELTGGHYPHPVSAGCFYGCQENTTP